MATGTGNFGAALDTGAAILLLVLAGFVAAWRQIVLPKHAAIINRFIFFVCLPCLVWRGLALKDFYSVKSSLWLFVLAFLVLRLVAATGAGVYARWVERKGVGSFVEKWLAMTWISTVIIGFPVLEALYGKQAQVYGILAAFSSFFFQLPTMLLLFEIKKSKPSSDSSIPLTTASAVPAYDISTSAAEPDAVVDVPDHSRSEATHPSPGAEDMALHNVSLGAGTGSVVQAGTPPDQHPPTHTRQAVPSALRPVLRAMTHNPVIIGIGLGFVFSLSTAGQYLHTPVLLWLDKTLAWFGGCVTPGAMFVTGMFIYTQGWTLFKGPSWLASTLFVLLKLVVAPLVMIVICFAFGLQVAGTRTGIEARSAVIVATLPISLASYSLAERYAQGQHLLATCVVAGTLLMLPAVLLMHWLMNATNIFPVGAQ